MPPEPSEATTHQPAQSIRVAGPAPQLVPEASEEVAESTEDHPGQQREGQPKRQQLHGCAASATGSTSYGRKARKHSATFGLSTFEATP